MPYRPVRMIQIVEYSDGSFKGIELQFNGLTPRRELSKEELQQYVHNLFVEVSESLRVDGSDKH